MSWPPPESQSTDNPWHWQLTSPSWWGPRHGWPAAVHWWDQGQCHAYSSQPPLHRHLPTGESCPGHKQAQALTNSFHIRRVPPPNHLQHTHTTFFPNKIFPHMTALGRTVPHWAIPGHFNTCSARGDLSTKKLSMRYYLIHKKLSIRHNPRTWLFVVEWISTHRHMSTGENCPKKEKHETH